MQWFVFKMHVLGIFANDGVRPGKHDQDGKERGERESMDEGEKRLKGVWMRMVRLCWIRMHFRTPHACSELREGGWYVTPHVVELLIHGSMSPWGDLWFWEKFEPTKRYQKHPKSPFFVLFRDTPGYQKRIPKQHPGEMARPSTNG